MIVSQENMIVPTSYAQANKRSAGRFNKMINFAVIVLLIKSMTEPLCFGFNDIKITK